MMEIPYDEAVAKIKEVSGLSEAELEAKVEDKLKQLSGLISKDGAIHIVANELGVKLMEPPKEGQELKISEVTPNSRGAIVKGRVAQKWDVKEFDKNGRKGKVANLLMGDETGTIRLTFWNDQVDVFEALKEDDVLVITNPFVKKGWQDRLEMQLNDQSAIDVNPEGVVVEKPKLPERAERQQKYIKDLSGSEENVEVVATIVQLFEPRFYDACPSCRKKVENNLCPNHGEVTPEVNFNMAAFMDDGTGNIRTAFWKKQSLQLTGLDEEAFVKMRDDPTVFEPVKTELLGEIIKIVGNVKQNEQFERMELNVQLVFKDVDPEKEIQNLERKMEQDRKEKMEASEVTEKSEQAEETPEVPKDTPEPAFETPKVDTPAETPKEPKVKEDVISLDELEEMGK